jgi:hypothetical protein
MNSRLPGGVKTATVPGTVPEGEAIVLVIGAVIESRPE